MSEKLQTLRQSFRQGDTIIPMRLDKESDENLQTKFVRSPPVEVPPILAPESGGGGMGGGDAGNSSCGNVKSPEAVAKEKCVA
jgi:hypothetical protein